jgi:hypothetical protein
LRQVASYRTPQEPLNQAWVYSFKEAAASVKKEKGQEMQILLIEADKITGNGHRAATMQK